MKIALAQMKMTPEMEINYQKSISLIEEAALRFFIILWNLNNILKRGDGMLEKFFSFGKAKGKQSDDTTGKYRTITEEEYQRYVFEDELFKIIVETEAALHNIEDPVEITVGVMKAACKFYGADWCGILIADRAVQVVSRGHTREERGLLGQRAPAKPASWKRTSSEVTETPRLQGGEEYGTCEDEGRGGANL